MELTEEFVDCSLNHVMNDISLAALEENTKEFYEIDEWIAEALEICQIFHDEEFGIMYEDVVMKGDSARKERRRQIKEIKKRTGSVGKNALKTYGNVTKIGGNIIFAGYSLIVKLVDLVVKVVKTVSDKLIILPKAIGGVIDKMSNVIPKMKSKIKGDLIIHVTPDNIVEMYKENFFVICDDIINNSLIMAEGDTWITRIKDFHVSDVQIARRIKKYASKLDRLVPEERTVNMNDKNNVERYFGNTPYIDIKSRGVSRKYTYFQALQKVSEDLKVYQNNIKKISNELDKKLMKTQSSQQFGRLPEKKQKMIKESVQLVSGAIVKIENFGKTIIRDINAVQKFIKECVDNTKKTPYKDSIRKNIYDEPDMYKLKDPDDPGEKPTGRTKEDRLARKEWRKKNKAYKARKNSDITKQRNIEGRTTNRDWGSYTKPHD